MLATVGDAVPSGEEWVHEVKWDGIRLLADIREGQVRLFTRSGRDVTVSYPELAGLGTVAGAAYDDVLLDGEVVAFVDGRPSFAALAERMHVRSARAAAELAARQPVTYVVFDLLRLFGQDVTTAPWHARRALLEQLDLQGGPWQVPPTFDDGDQLLAATAEQGVEGVVSKRRSSPYRAGKRSADWRKLAHRVSRSVVVGGWRPEVGSSGSTSQARLGAVLVGVPDGAGGWRFAGRVGSGLAGRAGERLLRLLRPLGADDNPFSTSVPREDSDGTTWVRPVTVIEVRHLGWGGGADGPRLRQPAYLGVRADLDPRDLADDGAAEPTAYVRVEHDPEEDR